MSPTRRSVVIPVYDQVVLLDVAGPLQVLHAAGAYDICLASVDGGPARTDVGLAVAADRSLASIADAPGTLLVPGALELRTPAWADRALVDQIRRIGAHTARLASVCAGALLLAEAGFLSGRRATTHWAVCAELGRFPQVTVEPDAIVVRDGPVTTSAGVTAGIDLALALVEEDLGSATARTIAQWLLVHLNRSGGQSQYMAVAPVPVPRNPALRGAVEAVAAAPADPHTLSSLAAAAGVSPRHLNRLFRSELDLTPGEYLEHARLAAARRALEATDAVLPSVARSSGFGSDETMRRAFQKHLGIAPHAYRERFQRTLARSLHDDRN